MGFGGDADLDMDFNAGHNELEHVTGQEGGDSTNQETIEYDDQATPRTDNIDESHQLETEEEKQAEKLEVLKQQSIGNKELDDAEV